MIPPVMIRWPHGAGMQTSARCGCVIYARRYRTAVTFVAFPVRSATDDRRGPVAALASLAPVLSVAFQKSPTSGRSPEVPKATFEDSARHGGTVDGTTGSARARRRRNAAASRPMRRAASSMRRARAAREPPHAVPSHLNPT